MPRSYAAQFRRMVIEQVRSGRRVVDVARGVDVPEGTVFRWVRQDMIDRGETPGTPTQESTELRAARRRIAELEAERATVKRASELFAPDPAQRAGGAPKSGLPHRGDVGK
jgi:transposase-like protein